MILAAIVLKLSLYGVFRLILPLLPKAFLYYTYIVFVIAVLTAYSRMYLSAHFFEDVVAGSVIGVIVTVFWLSWIDNKAFLHTEKWGRALLKKSS
ncbi:MAG: phosphatase PAP2 family protein [Pedobacter sp.]|nr:MAG: phosphatase PAP2 family protein [Pedobacter sp.]